MTDKPKIDTSQLGRICIDPNDDRIRADMVREAMQRISRELYQADASNAASAATLAFQQLIEYAKDDTLAKLYRMLNP